MHSAALALSLAAAALASPRSYPNCADPQRIALDNLTVVTYAGYGCAGAPHATRSMTYDQAVQLGSFKSISLGRDLAPFERVDVSGPGQWTGPHRWYTCGAWLFSAAAADATIAGAAPRCYDAPRGGLDARCFRVLSLNLPCQAERGDIEVYDPGF